MNTMPSKALSTQVPREYCYPSTQGVLLPRYPGAQECCYPGAQECCYPGAQEMLLLSHIAIAKYHHVLTEAPRLPPLLEQKMYEST